jgi:hypothetical protein
MCDTSTLTILQVVFWYTTLLKAPTGIDSTDVNTTTILVLLVLVQSNCSTPLCYCLN